MTYNSASSINYWNPKSTDPVLNYSRLIFYTNFFTLSIMYRIHHIQKILLLEEIFGYKYIKHVQIIV